MVFVTTLYGFPNNNIQEFHPNFSILNPPLPITHQRYAQILQKVFFSFALTLKFICAK